MMLSPVFAIIASLAGASPPDSVGSAFTSIESSNPTQRQAALSNLERLSRTASWKVSAPFLSVGTEFVRKTACKSIRNSKDPAYLPTFLKRIEAEKSATVGWCLANGIGEVARPVDVSAIARAWRRTRLPENRRHLLRVLGGIDSCGAACGDTILALRVPLRGEPLWEARLQETRARRMTGTDMPDSVEAWWRVRPEFSEFVAPTSTWRLLGDHRASHASRAKLVSLVENRTILESIPCEAWSQSFASWSDLLTQTKSLRFPVDRCDENQKLAIRNALLTPDKRMLVEGAWSLDLGTLWGPSAREQVYQYCQRRSMEDAPGNRNAIEAAEQLRVYLETAKPDIDWLRRKLRDQRPYTGLWGSLKIAICAHRGRDMTDSALCGSP